MPVVDSPSLRGVLGWRIDGIYRGCVAVVAAEDGRAERKIVYENEGKALCDHAQQCSRCDVPLMDNLLRSISNGVEAR